MTIHPFVAKNGLKIANSNVISGVTITTLENNDNRLSTEGQMFRELTGLSFSNNSNFVHKSGDTINGSLTINGNFIVNGGSITATSENVLISDNLLTINYLSGRTDISGVTRGYAGIEIDRGAYPNYLFEFNESFGDFRVGETGNTQAVATRENIPLSNGIAYWDSLNQRFNTTLNLVFNTLSATSISSTTYYGDGSQLSGIVTANYFTTGGTYSAGTATFYRNDGNSYSVTGFSTSNATEFTGGTVTGATNFTNGITSNTISTSTISASTIFSGTTDLSNIFSTHDYYTTGASLTNKTVFFNRNNGLSSYTLDLSTLAYQTDVDNKFDKSGGTINGYVTINSGLTITSFANSASTSVVYVTSGGTFELGDPLKDLYISDSYTISLITSILNWDINNSYTGPTLTGLTSGQKYVTSDYTFEYVVDTIYRNAAKSEDVSGFVTSGAFTSHTGDTSIHHTISELNNLYVNISGDTMTGTLYGTGISANTLSATTIYSGSTNLYNIFALDFDVIDGGIF